jgi:hypothetical protein
MKEAASGSWQSFEPAQWKLAILRTSIVEAGIPLNQHSRGGTKPGSAAQLVIAGTSSQLGLRSVARHARQVFSTAAFLAPQMARHQYSALLQRLQRQLSHGGDAPA